MRGYHDKGLTKGQKWALGEQRKTFDIVCDHYSPVFRFFFVERFGHSSELWYAARTRYTHSVAVSSMVGHILGIGKTGFLLESSTGIGSLCCVLTLTMFDCP
jgi:hypothetical protein